MGAVGLIMSWTTQEIGQGIKGAVSEDGGRTWGKIADMTEEIKNAGSTRTGSAKV